MEKLTSRLENYSVVLDILDGVNAHPNAQEDYDLILKIVKQLHEKVATLKDRLTESRRVISRQQRQVEALDLLKDRIKHIAENVHFYAPLVATEEMDSTLSVTPEPNGNWAHSSPIPSPFFPDLAQSGTSNASSVRPPEVNNQPLQPKTPKPATDLDVAISYVSNDDFVKIPAYMKGRIRLEEINSFVTQFNAVLNQKVALLKKPKRSLKLKKELDLVNEWKEQTVPALSGQYFLSAKDFVSLSNYKLSKKDFSIIVILRHVQRIKETRVVGTQPNLSVISASLGRS